MEELVAHVKNASRQSISAASKYYFNRGDVETCRKIEEARLLAKRDKIEAQLKGMK